MKTPLFFLTALVALFGFSIDFIGALSLFFAAGLGLVVVYDYRRAAPRVLIPLGAGASATPYEQFRLAA